MALLDQVERVEASLELAIAGVEVERAEVPELGGAMQLAAVEAERVESCSTGWSTAAQTGRGGSHRFIGGALAGEKRRR